MGENISDTLLPSSHEDKVRKAHSDLQDSIIKALTIKVILIHIALVSLPALLYKVDTPYIKGHASGHL